MRTECVQMPVYMHAHGLTCRVRAQWFVDTDWAMGSRDDHDSIGCDDTVEFPPVIEMSDSGEMSLCHAAPNVVVQLQVEWRMLSVMSNSRTRWAIVAEGGEKATSSGFTLPDETSLYI